MRVIKTYVCEYTEDQFDDLTELVEFLEGILKDKQRKFANEFSMLCYSEIINIISEKDTLNLFEDIIKINKEIKQCKFALETENSAPFWNFQIYTQIKPEKGVK